MDLKPLLPLAVLLLLSLAASIVSARNDSEASTNRTERLLSRVRRNKFVKKFLEKSQASQDKLKELESQDSSQDWPIIAWKADADVFQIGDDGLMESSPFEAVSEDDVRLEIIDDASTTLTDFSLKPASSYRTKLEMVRRSINVYNKIFLTILIIMCVSSFTLMFVRYWLIGLSQIVLRRGLHIEFPSTDGSLRQKFMYAMAFDIEDDLLDNPATTAEQGFAACLNDIVVAVESYTKNR